MGVRVFLAEDNDDLALLVRRRLEAKAWSVVRARTATEAAARLRGDRFDAVILDYQLPDGNGLDLLGVVRESAPATPVLFLTAHGSEDVAMRAMGLGATDYMQKTGDLLDELPGRVDALLALEADVRRAASVVTVPVMGPAPPERPDTAEERGLRVDDARAILKDVVRGDVLGAAFFDGSGEPIAALLPSTVDPRPLGLALVQVHAQAVLMGRTTHLLPRGYSFSLETSEGTLLSTGVAGRALVALLVRNGASDASGRLEGLAARLRG